MQTEKNPTTSKIVDVFGPTLEFLTAPQETNNGFCVLKGVIPPGISIPLHSHPDTEDFIILSGHAQILQQGLEGYTWLEGKELWIGLAAFNYTKLGMVSTPSPSSWAYEKSSGGRS